MEVQGVARERDVPGEAQLAELERLLLEEALHLRLADLSRQPVVLDDGEAQVVTLAEEQRPGLGARETPGFAQDPLQQDGQVVLAGQRDPDLHQILERLGEVEFRMRQRILLRAGTVRPRRLDFGPVVSPRTSPCLRRPPGRRRWRHPPGDSRRRD